MTPASAPAPTVARRAAAAMTPAEIARRNERVMANLGLVGDLAGGAYRGPRGRALDDMYQDGCLGLIRAAELFDPSLGYEFSTYATFWIRRMIQVGIHEARMIRVPHVTAWRARVAVREGDDRPRVRAAVRCLALRRAAPEALDPLVAEDAPPPDLDGPAVALSILPPRMRAIVTRRHGLDGSEPASLAAVGRELGISKERVRQVEGRAFDLLRMRIDPESLT